MVEFTVTYKARNINSKRILKQFHQLMSDVCDDLIVQTSYGFYTPIYDYSQLPEFLEAYCEELIGENVITTFDVLGDHRNNNDADVARGQINISLSFKQFNCLNTTSIDFTITKK